MTDKKRSASATPSGTKSQKSIQSFFAPKKPKEKRKAEEDLDKQAKDNEKNTVSESNNDDGNNNEVDEPVKRKGDKTRKKRRTTVISDDDEVDETNMEDVKTTSPDEEITKETANQEENQDQKEEKEKPQQKAPTEEKPKKKTAAPSPKTKEKGKGPTTTQKKDDEEKEEGDIKNTTNARDDKDVGSEDEIEDDDEIEAPVLSAEAIKSPLAAMKEISAAAKAAAVKKASTVAANLKESKYDPVKDAIWKKGQKTPYMHLAKTFAEIEQNSSRLKIIELLTNCFRSIIALSPEDLLPAVYLATNKLAPAHEGIELGIGESMIMKAIAEATGKTIQGVKTLYEETGDLGTVAQNSRSTQKTMFPTPPLTLSGVFKTFKEIATASGKDSMSRKKDKMKLLLVACKEYETQFIVRSLQGKLRIGLAEQSVLTALAYSLVLTPPKQDPSESTAKLLKTPVDKLSEKLEEAASTLKEVFSECPCYDKIIPVLLSGVPFSELNKHVHLTPGIPVQPMLAKPTKGITEVLDRFSDTTFTCEFKYDGERAQIHVVNAAKKDIHIFSRNAEDHTGKYPDLIDLLPSAMKPGVTSCVLDSEVVAYNVKEKKIMPFQVLSTRGRKNIQIEDIKVQVCLFAFDLLYLNGESLLKKPFKERRELLYASFNVVDDKFRFAQHINTNDVDEIQNFLNEAIEGNCEGLMVKTLEKDATYEPSKRSFNWLKVKKDYLAGLTDSFDLVPIGAYIGRGKRAGVYGGYLLACYDPESEQYQSVCKIGTGFSDENLKAFHAFYKDKVLPGPKSYYLCNTEPDVWLEDVQVWEVLAADLSISPVHTAAVGLVDRSKGIALRFPRFIRIREDKTPDQATTAQQVAEMYMNQQTKMDKNRGGHHHHDDDDDDY